MKNRYPDARKYYTRVGIDTDSAIERLKNIPVSIHCWQGDDVIGFDSPSALSGGIQTTGNYPGAARTADELRADLEKALSLIPGKHKLNLIVAGDVSFNVFAVIKVINNLSVPC